MDGFDLQGEAENARTVLLFRNGPIEFRERVFFTIDFPSCLVFVSFELVGAFVPGCLFGAAHE